MIKLGPSGHLTACARPVEANRRPPIFVSYASEDSCAVDSVCTWLTQQGFRVWRDTTELIAGQHWESMIEAGLKASAAAIVCLSRASTEKQGFIHREIDLILRTAGMHPPGDLFLIPLFIEECVCPAWAVPLHSISLRQPDWTDRLQQALCKRMEQLDLRVSSEGIFDAQMSRFWRGMILAQSGRDLNKVQYGAEHLLSISPKHPGIPEIRLLLDDIERAKRRTPTKDDDETLHSAGCLPESIAWFLVVVMLVVWALVLLAKLFS